MAKREPRFRRCKTRTVADASDFERTSGLSDETPSPPAQSRIELVESTGERLVLEIQPGNGRTTRMGWAVLAGVIFVCYLSQPHLFPNFKPGQAADLSRAKFYLYFAASWVIVVWGVAYWARLQFECTRLLIERDRVAVERVLFGWTRSEEVTFATAPCALVLEAFRGKFFPNQIVGIVGPNIRVTFGRMLTDTEKEWLVRRINRFFRAGEPSE